LREVRSRTGGRSVLFVPASTGLEAAAVADDAVRGLLELHEGPVLLLDLRVDPPPGPEQAYPLEPEDVGASGAAYWGSSASSSAVLARPFAGRRDTVTYAASTEFAARLAEARARYPYVLCFGGPVVGAVETLITAALFDGVVLSVAPGKTTRTDMQGVTAQLRRARANLVGFVVDERGHRAAAAGARESRRVRRRRAAAEEGGLTPCR
jgi:hypothetical protein